MLLIGDRVGQYLFPGQLRRNELHWIVPLWLALATLSEALKSIARLRLLHQRATIIAELAESLLRHLHELPLIRHRSLSSYIIVHHLRVIHGVIHAGQHHVFLRLLILQVRLLQFVRLARKLLLQLRLIV